MVGRRGRCSWGCRFDPFKIWLFLLQFVKLSIDGVTARHSLDSRPKPESKFCWYDLFSYALVQVYLHFLVSCALKLMHAGSGSGSVGGNVNGSKVQKRGPAGGRKPLGDLSNAGKQLSMNQTFKKQSSKGLNVIEEEIIVDSSKIKSNVTRKRSITKTADKAQSTSRKALTDISNSEKFSDSEKSRAPEALKKNTSKKLGVLPEDSIFADAFAEERFLHNHEECIKMQACAMSKDCFIETLGLDRGPQDGAFF